MIGDAAHLMTPFAGVGVNVAMQDSLILARQIVVSKSQWVSIESQRHSIAEAIAEYETDMFARAESFAKETMMYLNLFFNARGGSAMVEHFDRVRAEERMASKDVQLSASL